MDLKTQLLSELSGKNIDYIIFSVKNNKDSFKELIRMTLHEKDPLPMRASWVIEGITKQYPELILPHIKDLLKNLRLFTHTGTLKNILKIFSRMDIERKYHGHLADMCFEWIADEKKPVAVKAYSMQIIARLTRIYPELKNEFLELPNDQLSRNSAGFKTCARKIKRELIGING